MAGGKTALGVARVDCYTARMGNKDVISKAVLGHLAADIANLLLGFQVDTGSVELLDTEQQRVEQRRADLVARMHDQVRDEDFILHIEIQNQNDPLMPLRMLRYFSDLQFAHPEECIHQHLIYIGRDKLTMPDHWSAPAFTYQYTILDMHTVDCSLLLTQDKPEALVLAILCDFKGRPAQDMVNYIVLRLRELLGENESGFRNYFEMLETLAQNRDLQPQIEEAEKMLTEVDMTQFASYKWCLRAGMARGIEQGLERGREEGREEGREQGREEGREEGSRLERLRLARELLPLLDDQTIALTTGLNVEVVAALRKD